MPELDEPMAVGVGAAMRAGVSQKALRNRSLRRPFWGVRSLEPPRDALELAQMYAPRLRPGQLVSETSAARLHGLPLPSGAFGGIQVLVPEGAYRPSTRGVTSRAIAGERIRSTVVGGVPVTDPVLTWLLLGRALDVPSLVMIGDALVSTADNYPGLRGARPMATLHDLERAVAGWTSMHGIGRLRLAQPLVRAGVESPMETPTRLALLDHGLPEPEINGEILHAGELIARADLLYRDERVAIEYEGDGHRTDRAQWQRDVDRVERLHAAGWRVVRVTRTTLEHPEMLAGSVRALLATRPPEPIRRAF
ncbi:hypothetical protein [Agrococcus sp. SGAir0287]|uniref:hypothetical protein n=1 Tax=Agrococcus sp. SGAir0287 TaxID=2070347 RepID=UPI0010F742F7|nr:hypothetical protein [Agrococcus sp. SGAir0287]